MALAGRVIGIGVVARISVVVSANRTTWAEPALEAGRATSAGPTAEATGELMVIAADTESEEVMLSRNLFSDRTSTSTRVMSVRDESEPRLPGCGGGGPQP